MHCFAAKLRSGKAHRVIARIALIAALMLLVAGQAPAQQGRKALTVERIYGQPSLSGSTTQGLQWSPDGKLLSYFQRSGQGREARTDVWVMEVGTGERRVLLDSEKLKSLLPQDAPAPGAGSQATGLGRLSPQRYSWAPSGEAMLFISQGNLYWWDLKAQAGKRLTSSGPKQAAQDPKISPDGRTISFVRNHDLWLVDVATGKETQLTTGGTEEVMNAELDWVYPEELDLTTAYWWSPDSTQIAYLQMDERPVTKYPIVNYLSTTGETEMERYPKAGDANPVVRVGVVSAKGGETRWMDTGAEKDIYLARVNWLRDSKRLAIQRLNRAQNKLELLFADAATGKASVVLAEEAKDWVNVEDDLRFLSDGKRFVWSSERDGFRHLYLYDLGGKVLKQVTSGQWVVTRLVAVDEKNDAVYFTATEKSPTETHLYRVPLGGGAPVRVTQEDGVHGINLSPDASYYADSYSNVMTPTRQDLHKADGTLVRAINENKVAELAEYELVKPEFLTVNANDGTVLHAMMLKPPDFDASKKYPVLVHTYGGPHAQMVRDSWASTTFLWHQMMAQKGYIIFMLDNRGMAGRGHAFEAHVWKRMGEVELSDQLAGVAYLKAQPYVDGGRIGIWGWSYGGYMTLYSMLNAADVFKAGFAGAPVTDWKNYDTIYTERYMSRPQDNPEGYKQSAPLTHVAKLKGKLLIAHGTGDDNVHYANTVQFADELIKAGRYAEITIYPGRGHGIGDPPARIQLFRKVTQFFLDNL